MVLRTPFSYSMHACPRHELCGSSSVCYCIQRGNHRWHSTVKSTVRDEHKDMLSLAAVH
jgi:hypothetical protein